MKLQLRPFDEIIVGLGLQPKGPVQTFFTASCAKHNDPFVPFRTGALAETVIIDGQPTLNVEADQYTYSMPYAQYVYFGISRYGKELNYNKEKHSLAGPYWGSRMATAKGDDIVKEVQDFIDRGGNYGL